MSSADRSGVDPLQYLDAWNRHAVDELLDYFEESATYTDVALNESHTGKAAMRRSFE